MTLPARGRLPHTQTANSNNDDDDQRDEVGGSRRERGELSRRGEGAALPLRPMIRKKHNGVGVGNSIGLAAASALLSPAGAF